MKTRFMILILAFSFLVCACERKETPMETTAAATVPAETRPSETTTPETLPPETEAPAQTTLPEPAQRAEPAAI